MLEHRKTLEFQHVPKFMITKVSDRVYLQKCTFWRVESNTNFSIFLKIFTFTESYA